MARPHESHVPTLSPTKRALLEKWTRDGSGDGSEIVPRPPGEPPPLSFVQERQLFLELLDPHTAVNNLCMCVRLDGTLDLVALERSANRLLRRHEILRTSFTTDRGLPVATIAPVVEIELETVFLEDRGADALVEAIRLAEDAARRPFDLDQPPLLRMRVLRLAGDAHIVVVVVHHTIGDGWSLGVFLDELFTDLEAPDDGASAIAPLRIQYADFAFWQRQSLAGSHLERELDYWTKQLEGELPVTDLPIDHPRPARQTFAGATHRVCLSADLTDAVKGVSRRHHATPFMTLVAAFKALLHRYCSQTDILLGTPTAGRTRPETANLIGPFINTLVLRTDLSGDPTFGELLARVRMASLDAYAHQDLPFERLVARLRPQRDLSRTPVFQVMFILQNAPLPRRSGPGLSLTFLPIDRGAAQFDLTLTVTESEVGMDAAFEYNVDLFEASTIERLAHSFQLLLADAVTHPDRRISALAVMDDVDRRLLVSDWNATRAEYPRDQGVHELVSAQAHRAPDAVALVCGEAVLSYAELESRSRAVAAELQRLGVGVGDRVGVQLQRSPELVVALLAVLQAGAAYLPIDPATPPVRVKLMLQDAHACLLLTHSGAARSSGGDVLVHAIEDLETGSHALQTDRSVSPRDLAYVIYTSGSTGAPKGVLVPHRAVVNLLWSMRRLLGIGAGDRLLAVTSMSFDIAALEVFLPLIAGATIVLATERMRKDRRALTDAIARHGVNVMQATPATWRMMLQGEWAGKADLTALSGGEPLPPDLAEQLLERVGHLWNVYGPTETTIWSSAGEVRPGQHPITIGRPIANTELYIFDAHREPVPIGVIGELYIGGDGVSLGYVGRTDLTAERFVPNPFADGVRHERLFRTGDRARYRPDGTIELLGRFDDQVKINGFRVELGEVESALSRHPAVRQAAVVARAGGSLLAYVVPGSDPAPDPADLRAFLRDMLPAYMVPPVFVAVDSLPLSPAGKVDRRALPGVTAPSGEGYVAPRTDLEAQLAAAYARVLGVERVGIHDNFFDLGGGSIQILEIIAREQGADLTLTPELFFLHQSVAELASALEGAGRDA